MQAHARNNSAFLKPLQTPQKKVFALFVVVMALLTFSGCGQHNMNIIEGEFGISIPRTFSGLGKELPKDSTIYSLNLSANYTLDSRIPLNDVWNDKVRCGFANSLQHSKADMDYKIRNFPVSFSFTYFHKENIRTTGLSLYLDPFPSIEFLYGLNNTHLEAGAVSYVGIDINKAFYNYYALYKDSGILNNSDSEGNREGEETHYLWHFKLSFGGYISGHWNNFAVTYSPTIYQPYALQYDLPIDEDSKNDYDVSFVFPFLLQHYGGISFWATDHIRLSAGATLFSSLEFDDFYWTINSNIGYWF